MGFFEAIWDVLSTETAYTAATRFAAVLVFAAVGEWVAERSGTLNISIEAMILTGAFAGAMGYDWTEKAVKELNTIDNQIQVTLMSKEFGIWIKGQAFDE